MDESCDMGREGNRSDNGPEPDPDALKNGHDGPMIVGHFTTKIICVRIQNNNNLLSQKVMEEYYLQI